MSVCVSAPTLIGVDIFSWPREHTGVSETVHCDTHGETQQAFVCEHLTGESFGLGFNRNDATDENPFPDAWCDNCEIIRAAHDGSGGSSRRTVQDCSALCRMLRAILYSEHHHQQSHFKNCRTYAGNVPVAMSGTVGHASTSDSRSRTTGTKITRRRVDEPTSFREG